MANRQNIPGVQYQIREEDRVFLSTLGFDVVGYIGHGVYGTVFSGVCNRFARKLVPIKSNETQTESTEDFKRTEIPLNARSCAIKVIHMLSTSERKVYNEMVSLMELDHPNIVETFVVANSAYSKEAKNIYIITEFLNGGSLARFLNSLSLEQKLDEFTTIQIIRQLTAGLQYLHKMGKIHGDLHGGNIMFHIENNNMICKYVDFGNSQNLEEDSKMVDISKLGYLLNQVLDKSHFKKDHIKGNVRSVIKMMSERVFTDMDQVISHLDRYLPPTNVPPRTSIAKRFTNFFSRK